MKYGFSPGLLINKGANAIEAFSLYQPARAYFEELGTLFRMTYKKKLFASKTTSPFAFENGAPYFIY